MRFFCAGVGRRDERAHTLLVMPVRFAAQHPELSGEEQQQARYDAGYLVELRGPAASLADLLPHEATRDSTGLVTAPYRLLLYLLLPLMIVSGFVLDLPVAEYMVGPTRLGVALDIVLRVYHAELARVLLRDAEGVADEGSRGVEDEHDGLYAELLAHEENEGEAGQAAARPTPLAVLREAFSRIGTALRRINEVPFLVRLSDMMMVKEPFDEDADASERVYPAWVAWLTYALVRAANGSLSVLALLEMLMWPRFTAEHRCITERDSEVIVRLKKGSFYRLAAVVPKGGSPEEREVLASLEPAEAAAEYMGTLQTMLPAPNHVFAYPKSASEAQMAMMRYLRSVAVNGIASVVSHMEVLGAMKFFPTIHAVIGNEMSAAAAMGMILSLARLANLGEGGKALDVGRMSAIENALSYLRAMVERAAAGGMPPSDIVDLLAQQVASGKEMLSAAPRSAGGGSGASDLDYGTGAVSGYTAAQMPDLRKHIASEGFLTAVTALEGMRVRGAPPLEVVKYVFNSRQAILLQALLGHKHSIPSVPIVDWLIRTIRVLVAQALADLMAECATPEPMAGAHRVRPPPATELYLAFTKGNLNFDWENFMYHIMACCGVNANQGSYEKVPQSQVYTDVGRLGRLEDCLVPFFDKLGWSELLEVRRDGQARSLSTMFATLTAYVKSAASVDPLTLGLTMQQTVRGVLAELSVNFLHFLRHAMPSTQLDRAAICMHSPAMAALQEKRVLVPKQNEMQLIMLATLGQAAMSKLCIGGPLVPPNIRPEPQAVGKARVELAPAAVQEVPATAKREREVAAKTVAAQASTVRVGQFCPKLVREISSGGRVGLEFGALTSPEHLKFVDKADFYKVAPTSACFGTWMASSDKNAHGMCTHRNKKGCEAPDSVNHVVPPTFRRTYSKQLFQAVLVTAALASTPEAKADGAVFAGGAMQGARRAGLGRQSQAVTWAADGGQARPSAASERYSAGVLPAGGVVLSQPDGASWCLLAVDEVPCERVELLERSAGYLYMPVMFLAPGCPYVALPAGSAGAMCFGSAVGARARSAGERREESLSCAVAWTAALFTARPDLVSFGYFRDGDFANTEVSGFVASNPLPPFALTRRAASWRQLERMGGADPVWVSVRGLRGTPCHRMAMLCAARAGSFCWPARDFTATGATVGVLGPAACTPLEPTGGLAGKCTPMSPGEVRAISEAATLTLQEVFTRAAKVGSGLCDADRAAALKWLPSVKPVRWGELTAGAMGQASRCDFAGLAAVPWPAYVRPVSSAPGPGRPPPPPTAAVPASAKDWCDVLCPDAYCLVVDWMQALRTALRAFVSGVEGDELRRLMPKALALGYDCIEPWAGELVEAGHVLRARAGGGLELQDLSLPPPTHFNRERWQEMFDENESTDYALQSAVRNGISYLSKAPGDKRYLAPSRDEPVLLFQTPLRSLFSDLNGFRKAHVALRKMEDRGWFELVRMCNLDDGVIGLPSVPWRVNSNGLVIKANLIDWRGICDYNSPRCGVFLTVRRHGVLVADGPEVESLNKNCSVKASKSVRAEECPRSSVLRTRHTPALHRGYEPYGERDMWVAGPVKYGPQSPPPPTSPPPAASPPPSAPLPPPTSPPPAVSPPPRVPASRAGHVAPPTPAAGVRRQSRKPVTASPKWTKRTNTTPPTGLDESYSDWDAWLYPQELKPFFIDIMLAVAQMCHIGDMVGLPCIILGDDAEAFFHQWALAAQQEWMCGGLRLDPDALKAGEVDAALTAVRERCMAMGVQPSSNWAQRALTEITHCLTRRFAKAEEPHWAELEARFPRFRAWRVRRRKLSVSTGRDEARCMYCTGYTDDVITLILGAEAALRCVCLHERLLGPSGLNVLMADEVKRSLGVSAPFIGGNVLAVGAIGYIGPDKVHNTLAVIAAALEGVLTVARYVRLVGLLNHLVIILCLPYTEMYAVYDVLDRTRALGRGLDEPLVLHAAGAASLRRFRDRLLDTAAVSALAAVFPLLPAVGDGLVSVMHSDAAIVGTGNPALSGNLYQFVWHICVKKYTELPIVVLEFIGGIINLQCFASRLHGKKASLVLDALVCPIVMSGKGSSAMTRLLHATLVGDEAYALVAESLTVSHEHGTYNPVTDAFSRGKMELGNSLMRHMGLQPVWVTPPQRSYDLLDLALSTWRALTAEERETTRSRMNTSSSGPSPYVAYPPELKPVVPSSSVHSTASAGGAGAEGAALALMAAVATTAALLGGRGRGRGRGRTRRGLGGLGGGRGRGARGVLPTADSGEPQQGMAAPWAAGVVDMDDVHTSVVSVGVDKPCCLCIGASVCRCVDVPVTGVEPERADQVAREPYCAAAAQGGHDPDGPAHRLPAGVLSRARARAPAGGGDAARPRRNAFERASVGISDSLAEEAGSERLHDAANEAAASNRAARARLAAVQLQATAAAGLLQSAPSGYDLLLVEGVEFRSVSAVWRLEDLRLREQGVDLTSDGESSVEEVEVEIEDESPAAAPRASAAAGTRRRRCGECGGCQAEACGTCAECLDRPSRGGAGTRRRPCSLRRCLLLLSCLWLPLAAPAPMPGGLRPRVGLGRPYSCDVAGDGAARTAPLPLPGAVWRGSPRVVPTGAASLRAAPLRLLESAALALDAPGGGVVVAARPRAAAQRLPAAGEALALDAPGGVAVVAARPRAAAQRLPAAGDGRSEGRSLPLPVRGAPRAAPSYARVAAARVAPVSLRELTQVTPSARLRRLEAGLAVLPEAGKELELRNERLTAVMRRGYSEETVKKDIGHFRAWSRICERLDTSPWRTDVAANIGVDLAGHQEEIELMVHALIIFALEMVPRSSRTKTQADPRSGVKKIQAVVRVHWVERRIRMVPISCVTLACKGLMREYIEEHGVEGLVPDRKNPLTNELINGMLATPNGTATGSGVGSLVVDWASYYWTALRALFSVLAESGNRKDEVAKATAKTPFRKGRFTFASLGFKVGGVPLDGWPTAAQLWGMGPGDGIWLKHGVSKNDPVGRWFAATPTFLPWRATGRCACRALVALLTHEDATAQGRSLGSTPLFGPSCGAEFTHSQVDRAFFLLLEHGGGVTRASLTDYSVHSFRIFLCCALFNADCPRALIKRLLRWRGDESLDVYGRTDDHVWAKWLDGTLGALVDSSVVGRLPQVDPSPQQRAALLAVARSFLNMPSATSAAADDGLGL